MPTGDTVLIHGATDGVGQALTQIGRRQGLRMYGTASAPGSAQRLARYGVSFIDYRRQDFVSVIRASEPDGIQAVFDHIGGANIGKGYRLIARGGVLVSYSFAGRPGHLVADTLRGAVGINLLNLLPGKRTALCMVPRQIRSDHGWYQRNLERLLQMAQSGEITAPAAVTFPLAKVADAHSALASHEITGKVVLTTA